MKNVSIKKRARKNNNIKKYNKTQTKRSRRNKTQRINRRRRNFRNKTRRGGVNPLGTPRSPLCNGVNANGNSAQRVKAPGAAGKNKRRPPPLFHPRSETQSRFRLSDIQEEEEEKILENILEFVEQQKKLEEDLEELQRIDLNIQDPDVRDKYPPLVLIDLDANIEMTKQNIGVLDKKIEKSQDALQSLPDRIEKAKRELERKKQREYEHTPPGQLKKNIEYNDPDRKGTWRREFTSRFPTGISRLVFPTPGSITA